MGDLAQHASDFGAVRQHPALADAPEAQRPQRAPLLGLDADRRPRLSDFQIRHQATSVGTCGPRLVSLYARSRPAGVTSSGDFPRIRATSSGRFRDWRPAIVAWATLM